MALFNDVDPDGLLEYSVVYTDRALNHMSLRFQKVMRDLSAGLKKVYQADAVVIVPGSGTFAMEALARSFARGKHCMMLRNGFFNFRWSQIFAAAGLPAKETVLKARAIDAGKQAAYVPADIDEVVAAISSQAPDVVFATHVETAAGMILPDDYIARVAEAVHAVGGLFVLDCIASGAIWVDMRALGVDALISAPQKGWTASPCAGLVMLGERALAVLEATESDSFSLNLKTWLAIMRCYEEGGHAYHCTMPTDALRVFRDVMHEAEGIGFAKLKQCQWELGNKIRALLEAKGFVSLAAADFAAPSIVVCYTSLPNMVADFATHGVQVASGVPLKCDEPADLQTFRIGLLGLDKLMNVDRTVLLFAQALQEFVD